MTQRGDLARRLAVARGDEPADLVVRGGRVLSVFTREWLDVDVAICDGVVAGLGSYDGAETLDADGAYVVPGFIDAHMHLETSKLLPSEFARLVLPLGTTAVVADPHEIANVLGTDGVHWLVDVCENLPLDVFFTASSCVPASQFESPRRPFTPGDLESLLRRRRVIGLAEMMNFPGVIAGAESELAKLAVARGHHVDGHAPGVLGRALQAYAAAGIRSDHEAFTAEEGRERLRAGMWLLIREASAARNLRALAPLVVEFGPSRMAFCTDDREPEHIAEDGHINAIVRDAVSYGVAAEDALVMASHHPALWHGLETARGDRARLPGRPAAAARPRALRPRDRAQARPGGRRDRADAGAGVGDAERPRPAGVRRRLRGRVGGRAGACDRPRPGPDRDRVARRGALERHGRPGARPRQDRRDRAPSRHGPDRARLRPRLRPHPRRLRLDVLARRPQPRRRRR